MIVYAARVLQPLTASSAASSLPRNSRAAAAKSYGVLLISPDRLNARTLTASTAASSLPRNSSAAAGTPMAPYSLPRMPAMLLAGASGASPSRPGVVGGAATAADRSVALDQLWRWGSSIRWRRTDCSQQEHWRQDHAPSWYVFII